MRADKQFSRTDKPCQFHCKFAVSPVGPATFAFNFQVLTCGCLCNFGAEVVDHCSAQQLDVPFVLFFSHPEDAIWSCEA